MRVFTIRVPAWPLVVLLYTAGVGALAVVAVAAFWWTLEVTL